ncbi:hypothetical protein GF358_01720 [Candidatus Woesearchaeota archaeon]|nr:hypothetical protein [Candidatus Woesearchaeota archaeon]
MIWGITGTFIILVAYLLNLFNVLDKKHLVYLAMNMVGALSLAYYSFQINSIPFIILNIAWAAFTLLDFVKINYFQ